VVLHTISSFKKELLQKAAPVVLKGINLCIQDPGPLRNEMITSPDFWAILRGLSQSPQVATTVFEILEGVISGSSPPAIMADNYEAAIALLNDFASSGSVGSATEQKQDRRGRRGPAAAKQPKPRSVICQMIHLHNCQLLVRKLTFIREDDIVARSIKAVVMIQQLTARIPTLMQQSHLESSEGSCCGCHLEIH
jgi:brefeldin A-resistance guanine nucleotide exchange factor 1